MNNQNNMNRLLLLVGAVQGWALYGLWKARELKVWPALDPVSERALLYLSLALPLAFYLTEKLDMPRKGRRSWLLAGIGIVFALLGAYSGWADNTSIEALRGMWEVPPARPSDIFAAAILGFILIPLWAHYEGGPTRWRYHALFETAWRNGLLMANSAMLTGVFWMVLFAGAMLMKSIGLGFIEELIEKPIFAIPVSGIVFGAAVALSLAHEEWIVTLRRFWLSIFAWLLPLLLLFSVMWVIALPFTGVQPLFGTRNGGFILLWFIALSVAFANAAYRDGAGQEPYGRKLSKLLEYSWPTLMVLAGIAWWAVKLRIDQYGWTEDRVWAVFILLLASVYTVGYSYSLKTRRGWLGDIGKTNIAAALIMVIGLVALLSPVADARRIAVISQMNRVLHNEIAANKIDYAYLRWQAGRYGHDALNTLAEGIDHKETTAIASKAKQALAQQNRYGKAEDKAAQSLTLEQVRQRFEILPHGETAGDALFRAIQSGSRWDQKRCLALNAKCFIWLVDLNADNLKEAVLVVEQPEWSTGQAVFYEQLPTGEYRYAGQIMLREIAAGKNIGQFKSNIERGKVRVLPPRFNDIEIDGRRISVMAK